MHGSAETNDWGGNSLPLVRHLSSPRLHSYLWSLAHHLRSWSLGPAYSRVNISVTHGQIVDFCGDVVL